MRPLHNLRDRLNDWLLFTPPVVKQPTLAEQVRRGVGWCFAYCLWLAVKCLAYFLRP